MLKRFSLLYLSFLLFFAISYPLTDLLMNILFSDTLAEDITGDYQAYIYPLKAAYPYLTHHEWQSLLQQISNQSNLLINIANDDILLLNEQARQTIDLGKMVIQHPYDRDKMAVFARISDTVVIKLSALQVKEELYLSLIFIQFIAPLGLIALFTLGVMLWQQYRLNHLEKTSLKLAQGKLNARAATGWLAVGEINQGFNDMAEKLERMFNSQKHMITAVSHELKTPLFRLQMQLNLAKDEPHTQKIGDYLTQMHEDIDEMNTLIRELLSVSKMEQMDHFDDMLQTNLVQWLTVHTEQLAKHCQQPVKLNIANDIPDVIVMQAINSKQLKRALSNLVFNADRFAQTTIQLKVYTQDQRLCLSIEDDGIGIAGSERQRIFEPFSRIDSDRNRDSGGFGLGLAIVKEIIRCHGASISVIQSQLGGASFVISFPIQR
ncbi:ATP-binding protein [uncultured Shewanella sp.]|uniref:sensor histidine kinase n=1 Tax=uncultured Shewanella sp. TaxID=173975 RepID=UPI0026309C6D|nr:ATP-binding protein [uncultured Shewanella sp.]